MSGFDSPIVVNAAVVRGTTTNDSAATGFIGEHVASAVAQAAGVTCTTAVALNVTSISLTAGDWDVSGIIGFWGNGGSVTGTNFSGSIHDVSATLSSLLGERVVENAIAPTVNFNVYDPIPPTRFSLASTTTIYLVARATFTVGTCKAFGSIAARRVR
jgi:hypothetical protein